MRKPVTKKSHSKMIAHIFSHVASTLKAHMPHERTRQAPSRAYQALSLVRLISREVLDTFSRLLDKFSRLRRVRDWGRGWILCLDGGSDGLIVDRPAEDEIFED